MAKLHPFAAQGTLATANITSTQTTFTETSFAQLPVVTTPDTLEIVIDPFNIYGHIERISVTAHASSSNTITAIRAAYPTQQNGSSASGHNTTVSVTEQWFCAVSDQDFVHANLTGLSADDHPEYLLANGSRPMSGELTVASIKSTAPSANVNIDGNLLISGAGNVAGGFAMQSNASVGGVLGVTGDFNPVIGANIPCGRVYMQSGSVATNNDVQSMNLASFLNKMLNSSSGLEVLIAGTYQVNCQIEILVANGANVWILAGIAKNGSAVSFGNRCEMVGPFNAAASASDFVNCNAGDLLQAFARASTSSTCAVVGPGQNNFLSAAMVSNKP